MQLRINEGDKNTDVSCTAQDINLAIISWYPDGINQSHRHMHDFKYSSVIADPDNELVYPELIKQKI